MEVTSKPGEGSVFTVSLPSMEIGQAQQSDLETPPMENRAAPMVLCVMEDAHLLQTLEQHLREAGISCLTAGNGEDCLHIARREKPALITLDAILGDIEGWEVIKRLKADPETAKIPIVLTSLIGEEEALRIGASAVVPKPVNEEILLGVLLRLLNHSGERVLIVDDDRDFADVLQRTLRKQGLESDICFSGADALKACKEKNYDAIVLDYKMPAMSGLEVLKRLKLESRGDLHVIFISGSTIDKSIEQEALTLGSEIFLNKKIGIAEIAQAIQDRLKQVEKK
ncbi:MAG: response regulator [SAR324 cluster bacterium]|nr:response regulator [SAR324 cluster bacterium]